MAYRKIDQAMRRGKRWVEEQIKPGVAITPDLIEKAASEAFQHLGQQYLFMTLRDGSHAGTQLSFEAIRLRTQRRDQAISPLCPGEERLLTRPCLLSPSGPNEPLPRH